jgi:hypothetical protein
MSLCEKKKTSQLQATGNNFILGYGPRGRDCVCSMGHCAEFGSLLLEIAWNEFARKEEKVSTTCHSAEHRSMLWATRQRLFMPCGASVLSLVNRYEP